jgi:hypothetical protein
MKTAARFLATSTFLCMASAAAVFAQPQETPTPGMPPACQEMMNARQEFMKKRADMDKDLQDKQRAMNAASGQKKIDAMAALLNDLVAQHLEAHDYMQRMRDHMMKGGCPGMMGGMRHGMAPGAMPQNQ